MATGGREIRIYFEGDPALRPGFAKFLQNGLGRSVPIRLIATGGRPVGDFMKALRAHPEAENILLMDADVLLDEIGVVLSEIEGANVIEQLIRQLKNRGGCWGPCATIADHELKLQTPARWESETGGRTVKHECAACSFCGGAVEERSVSVDYRTKAGLVIIENVPAGVCRQCGERYYTAEVAKAMEKLAEAEVPASRRVAVPVREFSTSAAV